MRCGTMSFVEQSIRPLRRTVICELTETKTIKRGDARLVKAHSVQVSYARSERCSFHVFSPTSKFILVGVALFLGDLLHFSKVSRRPIDCVLPCYHIALALLHTGLHFQFHIFRGCPWPTSRTTPGFTYPGFYVECLFSCRTGAIKGSYTNRWASKLSRHFISDESARLRLRQYKHRFVVHQ